MSEAVSADDARGALASIERGRRKVIDEFGMPRWYWWSLAVGWIALGVVTDLRHPLLTTIATFVFGAAHASMYNALAAGRHRTGRLTINIKAVSWTARFAVVGYLVALWAVTVAGALLVDADGARNPVTIASVPVAVAIVLGGPTLTAAVRRRAALPHSVTHAAT